MRISDFVSCPVDRLLLEEGFLLWCFFTVCGALIRGVVSSMGVRGEYEYKKEYEEPRLDFGFSAGNKREDEDEFEGIKQTRELSSPIVRT